MSLFPYQVKSATNLDSLPAEIHATIAKYCSRSAVRELCSTSKRLHANCTPVLYRHVDLSFHNRGTIDFVYRYGTQMDYEFYEPTEISLPYPIQNKRVRIAFEQYNRFERVGSTQPKQAVFLKTLLAHPEYAVYVQSLSWTLLSWNHHLPTSIQLKEDVQKSMTRIWDVLETLRNVRTIDLAYLSNHLGTNLSRQCPTKLFSGATSIRLQGMMEHYLATSVLHSIDPAKLTRLCLDDLYDCGPKVPFVRKGGLWHADDPRVGNGRCLIDDSQNPLRPMTGLLGKLEGRCTALKSLTLRTKLDIYAQHYFLGPHDNLFYVEWAMFLHSVRGSLENFRLVQSPKIIFPNDVFVRAIDSMVRGAFCLDLDFLQTFWEVLQEGSEWPYLKTLDFGGVGPYTWGSGVGDLLMRQLRQKIGCDVEVDFYSKVT